MVALVAVFDSWRTHARLADARRELTKTDQSVSNRTQTNDELKDQLEKSLRTLATAQSDLADNQSTIAALRTQRDQAISLARSAGSIADEVGRCVTSLRGATDMLVAVQAGKAFDPPAVAGFQQALVAVCDPATVHLAELDAALEAQLSELASDPAPPTTSTTIPAP